MTRQTKFGDPTQYEVASVTIDGEDVIGLMVGLSIYEDIYRPCVTGTISLLDSDGATDEGSFMEKIREDGLPIQFIEPIEFEFKNALGESLKFEGVLNGLRNEQVQEAKRAYTIDFTSEAVRKNETTFVVKSYRDSKPEDIVREMVEKLGGELETNARGKQMQYLGSRRRPVDVIKYVLTHGLTQDTSATEDEDKKDEEASGTTGFLCWETVDGFHFEEVDKIMKGDYGEKHEGYASRLANQGQDMETLMKDIVQSDFKQIGDFQTKLRSGAFGSKNISFDMDKGLYKEYEYYNEDNMTEKQKKAFGERGTFSRFFSRVIDNQKFSQECTKAQPLTGDQSRAYMNQEPAMENVFTDQTGEFTLYPQFQFRAGDSFECKLNKVRDTEDRADGGPDKKHSGRYIIQQVAHHFFSTGKAYTRIKTIRSTRQQDDSTSSS